jgi:hypothetical protein
MVESVKAPLEPRTCTELRESQVRSQKRLAGPLYGLPADWSFFSNLEINCTAAAAWSLCGKRFRNSRAVAKARCLCLLCVLCG